MNNVLVIHILFYFTFINSNYKRMLKLNLQLITFFHIESVMQRDCFIFLSAGGPSLLQFLPENRVA